MLRTSSFYVPRVFAVENNTPAKCSCTVMCITGYFVVGQEDGSAGTIRTECELPKSVRFIPRLRRMLRLFLGISVFLERPGDGDIRDSCHPVIMSKSFLVHVSESVIVVTYRVSPHSPVIRKIVRRSPAHVRLARTFLNKLNRSRLKDQLHLIRDRALKVKFSQSSYHFCFTVPCDFV